MYIYIYIYVYLFIHICIYIQNGINFIYNYPTIIEIKYGIDNDDNDDDDDEVYLKRITTRVSQNLILLKNADQPKA
jgi:hypothetical protein